MKLINEIIINVLMYGSMICGMAISIYLIVDVYKTSTDREKR